MTHRIAIALLLLAAPLLAAPVPKDLKKKDVRLDGKWEAVEYYYNGKIVLNNVVVTWVIDGEKLSIDQVARGVGQVGDTADVTYALVKPDGGAANAIDYTYTNTSTPKRTIPGVFELEADSLKFCWTNAASGERPTECKPSLGTGMYVFKRKDAK